MPKRKRKPLIAESRSALDRFKTEVMAKEGYRTDTDQPDDIKYEVASERGIPLQKGYNGKLTAEQAGKIGGPIGGNMVKELVRMAQEQLKKK
ncbi:MULTISPECIES: alpha/beta-type small acid-soluble spore protein [Heyndrickxia]|uniref:alpha/beta-type small acid-soluble spore protein n=1 Tax=Heyndrickxia TaxID=2837504 RepID=UPI0018A7DF6C|nr:MULTISPECIES: alpha/beta-type small acid-soluble spore protein [Heyndrickxia]MBF8418256.1 alpha/beta-type small acid-soluble spore protein [Heyndrickxia coagulans]MEC2305459.1 alpha/beta-type small acid-soluble spore protein [Weizmannia sp. CD-2023]MEC2341554.1 alpha/beta-type small acid-soluble spore protein [Weizmannia sp. CD-2023]